MKAPPHHRYTLKEYFALEAAGDARYEYWDGEIICMSEAAEPHDRISENLRTWLATPHGSHCLTFSGSAPVKTPEMPPYRHPDASAVSGKPVFDQIGGIDVLVNPIIIIEVLSPGTEHLDKQEKRRAYQQLASVEEYLIVAQDAPHITIYSRHGSQWSRHDCGDPTASLKLDSINSEILVSDIYAGITFD